MNVDEAIAYSCRDKDQGFWSDDMHKAMVVLAAEVERLRAELTVREQEVICVRNSQSLELANCNEDNELLRAELAEAKKDKTPPEA